VSVPSRYLLTAALGLGLVGGLMGQEPARLGVDRGQALKPSSEQSTNQQMADTIAEQLRQSAHLQGYKINIAFQGGVADVSGAVTTQMQRDEAIRIVQGVPGVERVRNHLTLKAPQPVTQVQAVIPQMAEAAPVVRPARPTNQQMADTIVGQLRQSAPLQGYNIDVSFDQGTAELTGAVAHPMQHDEAIRIVQGIPGVERVRDHLTLNAPLPVTQAQAAMPQMGEAAPLPRPAPGAPPMGGAVTPFNVPMEPVPIFQAGYSSPYALNSPAMPPYAWPTYAPYNNYSRVATPNAYPYQSWPFIGPPYPFPKVPLGWRRVQLEWQDGHWWFGKLATCWDWWRLRYW
jgi:osmotically-inducible protein OsmY